MKRNRQADEAQPYKLEQAGREPSGEDSGEEVQRKTV